MCGRYYLDSLPETLMEHFSIVGVPDLESSFNIAPTQLAPIVRNGQSEPELIHARWGLVPFWAKDSKIGNRMINARSETIAEKPAFRAAWKRRRCLVPASGFFEWRRLPEGKQPYAIRPIREPLFAFAGLWETWKPADEEPLLSFTIITTRANDTMAGIHDRMPVLIPVNSFDHWLGTDDPRQLTDLLKPSGNDELDYYPVSREVNRPANNHPRLLEPVEPGDSG